jgi:hypothetical protein
VWGRFFHVVPSIYWNKIRQNEQPIDHFDFYFASAVAAALRNSDRAFDEDPRSRRATAMRSASTPVGTMSAGPRKLPALAMLP